jgi:hypothetical protein
VTLAGLFMVLAGFIGGVLVEKNHSAGATGSGQSAGGAPSGFTFGNGGAGGPTPSSSAASTTGTVAMVDGTTIYLTTSTGEVVIVKTNGSTAVKAQSAGAVKDLKVGDAVTVTGTTASDGSVTATQIARNP